MKGERARALCGLWCDSDTSVKNGKLLGVSRFAAVCRRLVVVDLHVIGAFRRLLLGPFMRRHRDVANAYNTNEQLRASSELSMIEYAHLR